MLPHNTEIILLDHRLCDITTPHVHVHPSPISRFPQFSHQIDRQADDGLTDGICDKPFPTPTYALWYYSDIADTVYSFCYTV